MDFAINYIHIIFHNLNFHKLIGELWTINTGYNIVYLSIAMLFFLTFEWIYRGYPHSLSIGNIKSKAVRHVIYYLIVIAFIFLNSSQQDFIYFQF